MSLWLSFPSPFTSLYNFWSLWFVFYELLISFALSPKVIKDVCSNCTGAVDSDGPLSSSPVHKVELEKVKLSKLRIQNSLWLLKETLDVNPCCLVLLFQAHSACVVLVCLDMCTHPAELRFLPCLFVWPRTRSSLAWVQLLLSHSRVQINGSGACAEMQRWSPANANGKQRCHS